MTLSKQQSTNWICPYACDPALSLHYLCMNEVLGSLNDLSDLHCRSEYAVKYPFLEIYPRLYFAQFFSYIQITYRSEDQ